MERKIKFLEKIPIFVMTMMIGLFIIILVDVHKKGIIQIDYSKVKQVFKETSYTIKDFNIKELFNKKQETHFIPKDLELGNQVEEKINYNLQDVKELTIEKEEKEESVSEKIVQEEKQGSNDEEIEEKIEKDYYEYKAENGKVYKYNKMINMESTAYTDSLQDTGKTPDHPAFGITYTGVKTRVGIVAVDPDVIALKTKLYVEGYGEAVAEDIGGAIKGNKIDLYFNTRKEALNYGRKYNTKVYVLVQ